MSKYTNAAKDAWETIRYAGASKKLAVVTTLFNPIGYPVIWEKWARWREQMQKLVDAGRIDRVITTEALWPGQPAHGDIIYHAGPQHIMWQRERLLSMTIASLPKSVRYLAWLDSDIEFKNSTWPEDTVRALQTVDIVQPFETITFGETPDNVKTTKRHSWFAGPTDPTWHTPGFAWAGRRSAIPNGLYDRCIVGSGDWAMALAYEGESAPKEFPKALQEDVNQWGKQVRTGFVPGELWHAYHGDIADRRYQERIEMLYKHTYDPQKDVRISSNGLLEFTGNKPELESDVKAYFAGRNEKR